MFDFQNFNENICETSDFFAYNESVNNIFKFYLVKKIFYVKNSDFELDFVLKILQK